jgi:hypothetical protein
MHRPLRSPRVRTFSGPRLLMAAGALLCLASLALPWHRGEATWSGGFRYGYDWKTGGTGWQYDPLRYYWPPVSVAGYRLPLGMLAALAALLLLVSAGINRPFRSSRRAALGITATLAIWWAAQAGALPGSWLFPLGLLLAGWAALRMGT